MAVRLPEGLELAVRHRSGPGRGAKNPPDFVLHVKRGQDYGFPKCNHTKPSACAGFAKPFRMFTPHTDLMGIAARGSKLYLTFVPGSRRHGPGR